MLSNIEKIPETEKITNPVSKENGYFLPTPLASPRATSLSSSFKNDEIHISNSPANVNQCSTKNKTLAQKPFTEELAADNWADDACLVPLTKTNSEECLNSPENRWNPSPVSIQLEEALAANSTKLDSLCLDKGDDSGKAALDDTKAAHVDSNKRGLPKACLFVASLTLSIPDNVLQKELEQVFSQYGKLTSVKVCRDFMFRPFAFVHFANVEDAKRALKEAVNTPISGRPIRIEQARVNRTLFVAKYCRLMNDEELRALFEQFGPLESFTVLQNYETGRGRDCGFIKYKFREDATNAFMQLRSMNLRLVLEWAENINPIDRDVDERTIFVGHLNQYKTTEELLKEKFEKHGEIANISLIQRPPQGAFVRPAFAFIEYKEASSAEKALKAEDGKEWLERVIKVQLREIASTGNDCENIVSGNKIKVATKLLSLNHMSRYPSKQLVVANASRPPAYVSTFSPANQLYSVAPSAAVSIPWNFYQQPQMMTPTLYKAEYYRPNMEAHGNSSRFPVALEPAAPNSPIVCSSSLYGSEMLYNVASPYLPQSYVRGIPITSLPSPIAVPSHPSFSSFPASVPPGSIDINSGHNT